MEKKKMESIAEKLKQKTFYKPVNKDMKVEGEMEFNLGVNRVDCRCLKKAITDGVRENSITLYTFLDTISVSPFYSRIFKAKLVNPYCVPSHRMEGSSLPAAIYAFEVELIEEIEPEEVDDEHWIYKYCEEVDDRESMWSQLHRPHQIIQYLENVKDRKELRERLIEETEEGEHRDFYLVWYCNEVEDKKEMWRKIQSDKHIWFYGREVADRKELRKRLESQHYIRSYCEDVKDWEELHNKLSE